MVSFPRFFPKVGHTRQRNYFKRPDVEPGVEVRLARFSMPPPSYGGHWWQVWTLSQEDAQKAADRDNDVHGGHG